tara:strand:+ start:148 stop:462 length:315 start_codon:yes stop_codon:yes gene_type:complete
MDVRRIQKPLQWMGIILVMITLTACGGGSGGDTSEEGTSPNTSSNNNGGTVVSTPTAPIVLMVELKTFLAFQQKRNLTHCHPINLIIFLIGLMIFMSVFLIKLN